MTTEPVNHPHDTAEDLDTAHSLVYRNGAVLGACGARYGFMVSSDAMVTCEACRVTNCSVESDSAQSNGH